jgi:hypothetical protein
MPLRRPSIEVTDLQVAHPTDTPNRAAQTFLRMLGLPAIILRFSLVEMIIGPFVGVIEQAEVRVPATSRG